MTAPSITVIYLFDPLCGWCYAAAPALKYLQGVEGIHVALAPTGLFAGAGARPMDAQFAAYAWANDQRIQQLTGQLFTQAYRDHILGAANRRFDSGPATLALTAWPRLRLTVNWKPCTPCSMHAMWKAATPQSPRCWGICCGLWAWPMLLG